MKKILSKLSIFNKQEDTSHEPLITCNLLGMYYEHIDHDTKYLLPFRIHVQKDLTVRKLKEIFINEPKINSKLRRNFAKLGYECPKETFSAENINIRVTKNIKTLPLRQNQMVPKIKDSENYRVYIEARNLRTDPSMHYRYSSLINRILSMTRKIPADQRDGLMQGLEEQQQNCSNNIENFDL